MSLPKNSVLYVFHCPGVQETFDMYITRSFFRITSLLVACPYTLLIRSMAVEKNSGWQFPTMRLVDRDENH